MRSVAVLGLPIVVNQASFALMQFTDAWIAGRLGGTALAAIGPAAVLASILSVCGLEALTSVTAQVSQSIGKGRPALAGLVTWQGIYCGALFGWACLIYYPTAGVIFPFLFRDQSPALVAFEVEYFQVSLLGLAPLMIATAIGNFFTGLGRPRFVMAAALVGVLANLIFSWGFTFGAFGFSAMGFKGIAWGTVLATLIQSLVLIAFFLIPQDLRGTYGTLRAGFSKKRCWKLLKTGIPAGIHGGVDYLAWAFVLTWLISFSGESHLAAQSIVVRCISLSFLPAEGMASALATLVGAAVGARDYLLARRYTQSALMLIIIWMTSMALIYFLFAEEILRLFTQDEAIIAAGRTAMLWVAAFQFFDALNVTYSNALQGAGDTAWPSVVNVTISLVVLLGGGLAVVTFLPGFASSGVWAAATLYVVAHGVIFHFRWAGRAWQQRRFIE